MAILDRMRDTLVILQAKHADADRAKVLAALVAICNAADAPVIIVEGATEEAAVRQYLAALERASLETPRVCVVRAGRRPDGWPTSSAATSKPLSRRRTIVYGRP